MHLKAIESHVSQSSPACGLRDQITMHLGGCLRLFLVVSSHQLRLSKQGWMIETAHIAHTQWETSQSQVYFLPFV